MPICTFFRGQGVGVSFLVGVLMVSGLRAPLSGTSAGRPQDTPSHADLKTNRGSGQSHAPAAMVVVTESIGTAWPIAGGYLVTNNHVVSDAESIMLIDQTGRGFNAWPVLLDELHDIAFLEVTNTHDLPPALPLAVSRTELDTRVFTVGFPNQEMSNQGPKQSQGRICGLNGTGEDHASYRTTVSVKHGNSGGPLVNMNGEVVGVVRSMLAYQDTASEQTHVLENASCAIKVDAVKDLLKLLPKKRSALRTAAEPTGNKATLFNAVAHSVLQVVARRYENASAD